MIYLDLETTGLLLPPQADPARQPRIVQAAWAVDDGPVSVELCHPDMSIPAEATRVHGITDDMVMSGVPEVALVRKLLAFLHEGAEVCAYNAAFDLTVLAYAAARLGVAPYTAHRFVDPMLMAEDRWGTRFKLVDLHEKLIGYRPAKAHDAAADVESLRRVHKALTVTA